LNPETNQKLTSSNLTLKLSQGHENHGGQLPQAEFDTSRSLLARWQHQVYINERSPVQIRHSKLLQHCKMYWLRRRYLGKDPSQNLLLLSQTIQGHLCLFVPPNKVELIVLRSLSVIWGLLLGVSSLL